MARHTTSKSTHLWLAGLLIILTGTSTKVMAEGNFQPIPSFSAFCSSTQAIGLDWEKGKWNPVRFKQQRFLIQKLTKTEIANDDMAKDMCKKLTLSPQLFGIRDRQGCYKITNLTSQPRTVNYDSCEETYSGGAKPLIGCEGEINLAFIPNGSFTLAPDALSIDNQYGEERDSLVISVGRCSELPK